MGREEQEVQELEYSKSKRDKNKSNKESGKEIFAKYFSKSATTIIIAVIVIAVIAVVLTKVFKKEEPVKEVITVSTLEKIVEVSDLSTFKVVYNGVACAEDKYYVSYEATVDAGIDFEKIEEALPAFLAMAMMLALVACGGNNKANDKAGDLTINGNVDMDLKSTQGVRIDAIRANDGHIAL